VSYRHSSAGRIEPGLFALACVLLCGHGAAEVRIAGSPWFGDAPTKVVSVGQFLRNQSHRTNIKVIDVGSGLDAIDALLRGECEFALAAGAPVAIALLRAAASASNQVLSPVVLASVGLAEGSHSLVIDASSGAAAPADLVGKRVAVMVGTSAHHGWSRFAQRHGLDEATVELVDVHVRDQANALETRRVDAVLSWTPWSERTAQQIGERARLFPIRQVAAVEWLLLSRASFIQDHPSVVSRVLIAYDKAIRFIHEEPDRARAMYTADTDLSDRAISELEESFAWRLNLDWPVLANLHRRFEWASSLDSAAGNGIPGPYRYLVGAPLKRLKPNSVHLPDYFFASLLPQTGPALQP